MFLHPDQQTIVKRNFNGPARVAGSAGTGKTVVALHRAVHLALKYPDAKVLVTTFSEALADVLQSKIESLIEGQASVAQRIEVSNLDSIGKRLFANTTAKVEIAEAATIKEVLISVASRVGKGKFTRQEKARKEQTALVVLLNNMTHLAKAIRQPNLKTARNQTI